MSHASALLCLLGVTCAVHALRRRAVTTLGVALGLLVVLRLGYWDSALMALVFVTAATVLAVAAGVPVGVTLSRRPSLAAPLAILRRRVKGVPVFVLLVPALAAFSFGPLPGVVVTAAMAMGAPALYTELGVRAAPSALREAADAFGANAAQRLFLVELPSARGDIEEGATRAMTLAASVSVLCTAAGLGGLGGSIALSLRSADTARALHGGLGLAVLATVLFLVVRRAR